MSKKSDIKEAIGSHLLDAMGEVDNAIAKIGTLELMGENYSKELNSLLQIKRDAKSILNKHFDYLAINRSEQ